MVEKWGRILAVVIIIGCFAIPMAFAALTASFSDTVWQSPAIKADNFHYSTSAIPTTDHTTVGTLTTLTVGENVVYGDALYMKSDGKLWKADADASTTMPIIAIATNSISADAAGNVLVHGFLRDDTYTWTPGQVIYGSLTGGEITATAPTGTGDQVQVIGVAISADVIYFNPSLVLIEVS